MTRFVPGVCSVLLLFASGCSCATETHHADAAVDAAPADVGADATSDAATYDGGTAFGRRCDGTHPCPSPFACIDGTCHHDCGGAPLCGSPEVCCASGEVCTIGGCVAPGDPCTPAPGCGGATASCATGFYCDAVIARCLPRASATSCTVPAGTDFAPVEYWHWSGSAAHPEFKGVLVTPIVADVNHDGASDVIVAAYRDPPHGEVSGDTVAILCALSGPGDCMGGPHEIFCTDPSDATHLLSGIGNLAVADLDATDGTSTLTIIGGLHTGLHGFFRVGAWDETGTPLWIGHHADGTPVDVLLGWGSEAIADLDGDGLAEIVVGATVFDHTGQLLWTGTAGGTNGNTFGPQAIAMDVDGAADERLEVVSGNVAYHADGTVLWTQPALADGDDGIADFDGDGHPEVVVVSRGTVSILDGASGAFFAPTVTFASLGAMGHGGAPTIADIDGDGHPDIGIATGDHYVALHVVSDPTSGHRITLGWSQPADDISSSSTASDMFDFDGDGQFEVVYQDTCHARVFAGVDGHVLIDLPNVSGTATNYPTIADLDGDGRAEFILVTDSFYSRDATSSSLVCPATTPLTDGVRVFRDAHDNWQTTRAIWNEHTYHVTNVCDGIDDACPAAENHHGAVPRHEASSSAAGLDSFRVNARDGLSAHDAPDLAPASIGIDLSMCPAAFGVVVDVANRGAAAVAAGTPVSLYEGDPTGTHTLLATTTTAHAIAPGGVERVRFDFSVPAARAGETFHVYVVVDDDGTGTPRYRECVTTNDASALLDVPCVGLI